MEDMGSDAGVGTRRQKGILVAKEIPVTTKPAGLSTAGTTVFVSDRNIAFLQLSVKESDQTMIFRVYEVTLAACDDNRRMTFGCGVPHYSSLGRAENSRPKMNSCRG